MSTELAGEQFLPPGFPQSPPQRHKAAHKKHLNATRQHTGQRDPLAPQRQRAFSWAPSSAEAAEHIIVPAECRAGAPVSSACTVDTSAPSAASSVETTLPTAESINTQQQRTFLLAPSSSARPAPCAAAFLDSVGNTEAASRPSTSSRSKYCSSLKNRDGTKWQPEAQSSMCVPSRAAACRRLGGGGKPRARTWAPARAAPPGGRRPLLG